MLESKTSLWKRSTIFHTFSKSFMILYGSVDNSAPESQWKTIQLIWMGDFSCQTATAQTFQSNRVGYRSLSVMKVTL